MSITDLDLDHDRDLDSTVDRQPDDHQAESSALQNAISGLAGLALGSTIVYFASRTA